jgi:hypothetical protein
MCLRPHFLVNIFLAVSVRAPGIHKWNERTHPVDLSGRYATPSKHTPKGPNPLPPQIKPGHNVHLPVVENVSFFLVFQELKSTKFGTPQIAASATTRDVYFQFDG